MSARNDSVGRLKNGSMKPVVRSGMRIMSPDVTGLYPTEEPSNPIPSRIICGVKDSADTETWCQRPNKSPHFRSIMRISFSFRYFKASSKFWNINKLLYMLFTHQVNL